MTTRSDGIERQKHFLKPQAKMTKKQIQLSAKLFMLTGLISFALALYAQEPLHTGIMSSVAIIAILGACSLNTKTFTK